MPENSVRPRKPSPRDSATAARVPSRVAIVAAVTATRRLIQAASIIALSLKNSRYQRGDQPPHTVTSRESLKEKITRITIGRYRNASPRVSEATLKRDIFRTAISVPPAAGVAAGRRAGAARAA